jgi:hypothetical protein
MITVDLFLGYGIQWNPPVSRCSSVGITMPLALRYLCKERKTTSTDFGLAILEFRVSVPCP